MSAAKNIGNMISVVSFNFHMNKWQGEMRKKEKEVYSAKKTMKLYNDGERNTTI